MTAFLPAPSTNSLLADVGSPSSVLNLHLNGPNSILSCKRAGFALFEVQPSLIEIAVEVDVIVGSFQVGLCPVIYRQGFFGRSGSQYGFSSGSIVAYGEVPK